MKVLISGGTGFIGSNLVERLLREGENVAVLARKGTKDKAKCLCYSTSGQTEEVIDAFETFRPDAVIHLASLFLAAHKPEDLVSLIQSNLLFGTQLLEGCIHSGTRYFINTGTSWQHYLNEEYNPVCLYAATKKAFEDLSKYYQEAHGLKVLTLKLFDTYGPGDPRPKLVSLLLKTAQKGEVLGMSPGEQILDLVHVDDVVDAFVRALSLIQQDDFENGSCFAVSSNERLTLKRLVALVEELYGKKLTIEFGKRPYRYREVLEPWNAFQLLPGWAPKIKLADGLRDLLRKSFG